MRKIFILTIMVFAFVAGYSKSKPATSLPVFKKYLFEVITPFPADPCLDAALNAQANAFSTEQLGHNLCSASVLNGSLAPSEYGGCCYAFTLMRQISVAYIQSSFVPCPSGIGVGII